MTPRRFLSRTATTARLVVLLAAASTALAEQPRSKKFELLRGVEYVRRGDVRELADVTMPIGEREHPAVLLVHGGGWMTGRKEQMNWLAERLAVRGYTAVSINYRLAPKYPFPAQIEDCQAAVRWMRKNAKTYRIDPRRIAGYGFSAGGHLVALLGVCGDKPAGGDAANPAESTRLQCVVAGGAPCDFRPLPNRHHALAYWLGGSRGEKPDVYASASPAAFVSKDDPPVFFFHGEQDRLVPKISPTAMASALQAAGVEVEFYTVPGAGHIKTFFDPTAADKAAAFLDRHLQTSRTSVP